MRVIAYRVGRGGLWLTPAAILLVILSHICCLLPVMGILGLGSAISLYGYLKPWFYVAAVFLLTVKGCKIYHSPHSGLMEKIFFCAASAFVLTMILTN